MIDFLKFIISGPMLVYTIPLCLVLLYWAVMIFGVVDIDFLDGGVDAAVDGAVDGALDGAADAATDSVIDVIVDSADEGIEAAQGALTGAGTEGMSAIGRVLHFLNFGSAPATIVLTFLVFTAWLGAAICYMVLPSFLYTGITGIILFLLVMAIVAPVSFLSTHFTTKPFRGLMKNTTQHGGDYLLGRKCTIKTSEVTEKFGQAEVEMRGSPLLINVVCEDGKDYGFKKGDTAFIIYYDKEKHKYVVSPFA